MSPVLRQSRTSVDPVRVAPIALDDAGVSARAHAYAGVPGMAVVVVPDGAAVPMPEHFRVWSRVLVEHGFTSIRTGALAPRQADQALRAGLRCVQELALLEVDVAKLQTPRSAVIARRRTHRLRRTQLSAIADVDRAAFGPAWWLDASMLSDVRSATPVHRARVVHLPDRPVAGFLISGRAGRTGYVQRLAVHPDAHRNGLATDLLIDSLQWMRRARLQRAFVNTHVDNAAALALYRTHGFVDLPERLRVFEGAIPL